MNLSEINVDAWPHWRSDDGNVLLVNGDCLEVLKVLPKVDCVVTDPPYGIGESSQRVKSRQRIVGGKSKSLADQRDYGDFNWDAQRPSDEAMRHVTSAGKWCAVFGGNYFAFPPSSCWLVWDKLNGANDFADCELAWTNWPSAVRRIQWLWNGMLRKGNDERVHPTQKPTGVMEWCIGLAPKSDTVLDPYMGSGTTGVACVRLGRQFIGIELEPKYYQIAIKRIRDEQERFPLFEKQEKVERTLPGFESC